MGRFLAEYAAEGGLGAAVAGGLWVLWAAATKQQ